MANNGSDKQTIFIHDALCEGPIQGLVNGNSSVYVAGTPFIDNDTSSSYYPNTRVDPTLILPNSTEYSGTLEVIIGGALLPAGSLPESMYGIVPASTTSYLHLKNYLSETIDTSVDSITFNAGTASFTITKSNGPFSEADWNTSIDSSTPTFGTLTYEGTLLKFSGTIKRTNNNTIVFTPSSIVPQIFQYLNQSNARISVDKYYEIDFINSLDQNPDAIGFRNDQQPATGFYEYGITGGILSSNTSSETEGVAKFENSSFAFRDGSLIQDPIPELNGVGGGVSGTGAVSGLPQLKQLSSSEASSVGWSIYSSQYYPEGSTNDGVVIQIPAIPIAAEPSFGLNNETIKNADELRVQITYPSMIETNTTHGDQAQNYAFYKMEISFDGGTSWVDAIPGQSIISHSARTTAAIAFEHYIDLNRFRPFDNFTLRIGRLSRHKGRSVRAGGRDGDKDRHDQGDTTAAITSLGYEIKDKFSYPYTAHAAISFSSEDYSSVPSRSYDIYGKKVRVPTNYITREESSNGIAKYDGFWDGALTNHLVYTDNPAWVFYDIVTNNRYGAGEWLSEEDIDIYSLYKISQYCDELVPSGKKDSNSNDILEPRFRANLYLTKATDAYKVLKDIATIFTSILYWMDGKLTTVLDAPADPVYSFSKSNVIDGQFNYETTGNKTRVNQVVVTWNNPEANFEAVPLIVEDRESITRTGKIISQNSVAFGCTSEGQAIRYGRWKLFTAQNQTEIVNFKTSINSAFIKPGDIVQIQDADRYGKVYSGRLTKTSASTTTVLKLDRNIAFNVANTYEISVLLNKPGAFYTGVNSVTIRDASNQIVQTLNETTRGVLVEKAWIATSNGTYTFKDIDTEAEASNAFADSAGTIPLQLIWKEYSTVETRTIDLAGLSDLEPVNEVTVTSAFSAVPTSANIWTIKETENGSTVNGSAKLYKILSVSQDDLTTFSISAVEHYNEKYNAIDLDYALGNIPNDIYGTEPELIPAPKNLGVRAEFRQSGTQFVFSWEPPQLNNQEFELIQRYEIYTDIPNASSPLSVPKDTLSFTVPAVTEGDFIFRVRVVSPQGNKSKYTSLRFTADDVLRSIISNLPGNIPQGLISETFGYFDDAFNLYSFESKTGAYAAPADPFTIRLANPAYPNTYSEEINKTQLGHQEYNISATRSLDYLLRPEESGTISQLSEDEIFKRSYFLMHDSARIGDPSFRDGIKLMKWNTSIPGYPFWEWIYLHGDTYRRVLDTVQDGSHPSGVSIIQDDKTGEIFFDSDPDGYDLVYSDRSDRWYNAWDTSFTTDINLLSPSEATVSGLTSPLQPGEVVLLYPIGKDIFEFTIVTGTPEAPIYEPKIFTNKDEDFDNAILPVRVVGRVPGKVNTYIFDKPIEGYFLDFNCNLKRHGYVPNPETDCIFARIYRTFTGYERVDVSIQTGTDIEGNPIYQLVDGWKEQYTTGYENYIIQNPYLDTTRRAEISSNVNTILYNGSKTQITSPVPIELTITSFNFVQPVFSFVSGDPQIFDNLVSIENAPPNLDDTTYKITIDIDGTVPYRAQPSVVVFKVSEASNPDVAIEVEYVLRTIKDGGTSALVLLYKPAPASPVPSAPTAQFQDVYVDVRKIEIQTTGDNAFIEGQEGWYSSLAAAEAAKQAGEILWIVGATGSEGSEEDPEVEIQDGIDIILFNEWSDPPTPFTGLDGLNISTVALYQVGNDTENPPTTPGVDLQYIFGENKFVDANVQNPDGNTPSALPINGWDLSAPSLTLENKYLWKTTAAAISNTFSDIISGGALGDWSEPVIVGAYGDTGVGASAVKLTAEDYSIIYDENGGNPKFNSTTGNPGDITLNAEIQNVVTPVYRFTIFNNTLNWTESNTTEFTVPTSILNFGSGSPEGSSIVVSVEVAEKPEDWDTGGVPLASDILSEDSISITAFRVGVGGISVLINNPTHQLPCDYTGRNIDSTGSGTLIEVISGGNPLEFYDSNPPVGGWTLSIAPEPGVTIPSVTKAANWNNLAKTLTISDFVFGDTWRENPLGGYFNSGDIDYTITIPQLAGDPLVISAKQTFVRNREALPAVDIVITNPVQNVPTYGSSASGASTSNVLTNLGTGTSIRVKSYGVPIPYYDTTTGIDTYWTITDISTGSSGVQIDTLNIVKPADGIAGDVQIPDHNLSSWTTSTAIITYEIEVSIEGKVQTINAQQNLRKSASSSGVFIYTSPGNITYNALGQNPQPSNYDLNWDFVVPEDIGASNVYFKINDGTAITSTSLLNQSAPAYGNGATEVFTIKMYETGTDILLATDTTFISKTITDPSPVLIELSNDNITIATPPGAAATGLSQTSTVSIFKGSVDITSEYDEFTASSLPGVTGSIPLAGPTYTLTELGSTFTNGTITITCTDTGSVYPTKTASLSLSRVENGTVGFSATAYSLVPDVGSVILDEFGVIAPSSVSFTAKEQVGQDPVTDSTTATVNIYASADGATWGTAVATGTGSATFTLSNSPSYRFIKGEMVEDSIIVDVETIPIVTNGTSAGRLLVSNNDSVTVSTPEGQNYTGSIDVVFSVFAGASNVTGDYAISIKTPATGVTAAMSTTQGEENVLRITQINSTVSNQTIVIQAQTLGYPTLEKEISINRIAGSTALYEIIPTTTAIVYNPNTGVYTPALNNITWNFYKVENGARTAANVWYSYEGAARVQGTSYSATLPGIGTRTTHTLSIYSAETGGNLLDTETVEVVSSALAGEFTTQVAAYRKNSSADASGGSYDFTTNTLTPPTNWFIDPPDLVNDGDTVYVVVGSATGLATTDNASISWGTPAVFSKKTDGVNGTSIEGPAGVRGPRIVTGYIYYNTAQATAPTVPSAANLSINWSTGAITPPTGWSISPPTFEAGTTNTYWYYTYTMTESGTYTAGTDSYSGTDKVLNPAAGQNAVKGIGFQNLVTFTSLTTPGQTQIDGSNITTGTISAARISLSSSDVSGYLGYTPFDSANAGSLAYLDSIAANSAFITGLGSLALKNSVSATSDVTGLGTLATKNSVSATTEVTGLLASATSETSFNSAASAAAPVQQVQINGVSQGSVANITPSSLNFSSTDIADAGGITGISGDGITVTGSTATFSSSGLTISTTQLSGNFVSSVNGVSGAVTGVLSSNTNITAGKIELTSGSLNFTTGAPASNNSIVLDTTSNNNKIVIYDGTTPRVILGKL